MKKKSLKNKVIVVGSEPKKPSITELLSSIHQKNLMEKSIKKDETPVNQDLFLPDSNIEELITLGKTNTEKEINKIKNSETK